MKKAMVASDLKNKGGLKQPSEESIRNVRNAERDLHKHFVRIGLSLPIPIHNLEHTLSDGGTYVTEYINPSDWLHLLLQKFPRLISGGASPLEEQLEGFWGVFRLHHGEHEVFTKHASSLCHVIPLCFWGDEGRGPRRSGFLEATLETPLGLSEQEIVCDCGHVLGTWPTHWLPSCEDETRHEMPKLSSIENLGSNYYGHSFLKRYYLFGLPGYIYSGEPGIIEKHLQIVATDLKRLFNEGIPYKDTRMYGALIGSKGDMKFQAQTVAWMTRSYSNLGTRNQAQICSLCRAGDPDILMEDTQLEPDWKRTLYFERPWDNDWVPALTEVPYDGRRPELLYKLDFFHCFKVGLGRDLAGSSLIWLCYLGVYDFEGSTQNIDDRLCRCYGAFKLWALTEKYSPALRSFSKSFFNHKGSWEAPWSNSKGSDTMILLKYVRFQLSLVLLSPGPLVLPHVQILGLLRDAVDKGIDMCDALYSHNLLLPRTCASRLYLDIMVVIRGYKRVAAHCLYHGFSGFRLKPKLHAMAHIAFELREVLKKNTEVLLSPLVWSCELNEDHIGHVARVSRKLNTKTLGLRMVQRYLLKSKAIFRRFVNNEKFKKPLKRRKKKPKA